MCSIEFMDIIIKKEISEEKKNKIINKFKNIKFRFILEN